MSLIGQRLPHAVLGRLVEGELQHVDLERHLAGKRALLIGAVGAFTPVCHAKHIPDFISETAALRKAGFSEIICVCPNDPWTTAAWARAIDPDGRLTFLSDGNLELAEKIGAVFEDHAHFLGRRNRRYLIATRKVVVERISIETSPITLICTRVQDVVLLA